MSCEAARAVTRAARTQSSLAIRATTGRGSWSTPRRTSASRSSRPCSGTACVRGAVRGIVLTDAEIDHTAGLLLMRESSVPLRVFGAAVGDALTDEYPVLRMLERYCGVEWRTLEPGEPRRSRLEPRQVEPFATGGDAPRYLGTDGGSRRWASTIRDRASGGTLTYAPGSPGWTTTWRALRRQRLRLRRRHVLDARRARALGISARATRDGPPAALGRRRDPRGPRGSCARRRSSCTSTTRTRSCWRTRASGSK